MAGLGLEGAYGVAKFGDTLHKLLQEREAARLVAAATDAKKAQQDVENQFERDKMAQQDRILTGQEADRKATKFATEGQQESSALGATIDNTPGHGDLTGAVTPLLQSQHPQTQTLIRGLTKINSPEVAPMRGLPMGLPEGAAGAKFQNPKAPASGPARRTQMQDVPAPKGQSGKWQQLYDLETGDPIGKPTAAYTPPPNQGIPFSIVQGPQGPGKVDRKEGTFTPLTDTTTGEAVGRAVSPQTAEKASGIEQSVSIIQKLIATPKDHIIGPLQGRAREVGTMMPGYETPQDVADFIADSNTLQNNVIKAITGAQMSEVEAKRIKGQIPLVTDQATIWNAKAKATIDNLQLMHDRMLKLGGAPNSLANSPKAGGGMPPASQRVAGQTTYTFPDGPSRGKTGTWDGTSWVIK